MKIKIIVVGKLKGFATVAVQEYLKMLQGYSRIQIVQVKGSTYLDSSCDEHLLNQEAEQVMKHLKDDYVILLDERGKEYDSIGFAKHFEGLLALPKSLVFVIGGPFGVSETLRKRADEMISLSKLTFTHQLAVVVLLEQLLRAFKIINNEKYHY
ncbi:23S rRNA (pseudouridine(1915)-N(3))-methyltransferase RlmH [Pseudothermotoga thermarum]|uniref:Ribosomal RNA large subunit methyltransferase H n=1 Tax=Pseudothermotoga thermarum DSM 5069 TaxID=688269 RepID=F7YYN0_9THEM|nr:23S rRNA (pseudouridine(1915)-N(3))-methyltransferase RlmH [Pseudothermotoga thermarum]AEH51062.1 protein of unknown function DUF163 [Pseudothermotoga thermarum DSM 5069]